MGRRSRRRGPADLAAPPPRPAPAPRRGRRSLEDRPRAPWHPFPLVELCVLLGLLLLVLGLIGWDTDRGRALLVAGMALGSLGGLDTALREHFSGYRSHSTVLAAVPAVLAAAALYFATAPWIAIVILAPAVFAAAFWALRRRYLRRRGQ